MLSHYTNYYSQITNTGIGMKKVNETFTTKLAQHKKLVANMVKTEDKEMVIPVHKAAKELALAYAYCRCEHCKSENNLQYHHLIQRNLKKYMDFWKYMSQRYYWANILILCRECHKEIEQRGYDDLSGTIPQKTINQVKKKYGIK